MAESRLRRRAAALARRTVLVRAFDDPSGLCFGLPASLAGWQRLDTALGEVNP
ncbi:hypothetical protein [Arhodomonas sp. SL1]|uniref:hypothetical protein n=1 Tax=Arhodomonas sp. SL1 TaxID=3425691 RepID=UPI003F884645